MLRSAAVLAALAIAITSCGNDERSPGTDRATTARPTTSTAATPGYPEQVRENFVTSCERASSGETAICRCFLRELEQRLTLEEFQRVEAQVKAGGAAADAANAKLEFAKRACT